MLTGIISNLLAPVCTSLGTSVPILGPTLSQFCNQIVALLRSFGL